MTPGHSTLIGLDPALQIEHRWLIIAPEATMADLIQAFNSGEVLALTGVSLRRLQYWDETDLIRPSIAARRGRGSPRLYGFRDLIALRIAARLRDQLLLQALRKLKEALDVDAPFASVRFALLPGGDVVYLGPTGQLEAARRPGQITMSADARATLTGTGRRQSPCEGANKPRVITPG